jgi:transposase InsO family protein
MFHLSRVLELIHGDLCGKISPPTLASNQYFLLLVDDRSRFMSVVLLSSKDQVDDAIQKFQVRVKCRTGEKLGGLRTDRGGEFNSKNFAEYCLEHGVWRQLTMPYSPQQNGVVERRNGTVVGTAKSMMKVKSMPAWFSGEAILMAIYILNRLPTKSVEGATPFELWYGKILCSSLAYF